MGRESIELEELWGDYLLYLIWRGGLQRFTKYGRLFDILHHIKFEVVLDRDDNREEDGCDLRNEYNVPNGFSVSVDEAFYARQCSVLEMLIALAIRVDDEIIGDPAEEHPERFFMEMIKNLKLDRFKGEHYESDDVIKIIRKWMSREFNRDGYGSPFPVKYDHRDQRELEIWDQMNSYISENYG